MNFNKKYLVSSVVLVGSMVLSGLVTFGVKSNADEETLYMVKMQLQEQIDEKSKELEDKDKQLEDLNNKVAEQENTINQLNTSVQSLNKGLNNAQQIQKQDKVEVIEHSDNGDANLQQQIDSQKAQKEAEDKKRAEAKKNIAQNAPDNPKNNDTGNGAPYQKIDE